MPKGITIKQPGVRNVFINIWPKNLIVNFVDSDHV